MKLKWQLHLTLCDYCCLILTPSMQPCALARQHKGVGDHGLGAAVMPTGGLYRAAGGGKEVVVGQK